MRQSGGLDDKLSQGQRAGSIMEVQGAGPYILNVR